jgi:thiol-disulfide isomerase/thioredoxin
MNKKLDLIILVGSLALVLALAFAAYNYLAKDNAPDNFATLAPTPTTPSDGTQPTANAQLAPDFTVYDAQGNAHKLSDFRGKPVVLNFWASWCGPCKSEMPDFDAAYQTHGQEVQFLMVNLTDGYQETKESASAFVAGSGYSFPVFYDTDVDAAQVYGISAVPVTYFIDASGYLIAVGQGALSAENLEKGITMIK